MKNKVELKKALILSAILVLIVSIVFGYVNYREYKAYTITCNQKIDMIVGKINKEYPNVSKDDIIKILDGEENTYSNVVNEYGINLKNDTYVLENDNSFKKYLGLELGILAFLIIRHKPNLFDIQLQKRQKAKRNYNVYR